jgi:cholest-4-en-3-one 26-monooxygenase
MTADAFDFTDLEVFEQDVPYEALATLRREIPVYWNAVQGRGSIPGGFWLITKHKDIVQVEKNTQLFSSHEGLTLADAPSSSWGPPWLMVRDGLTHLDPPMHSAHKKIVAPSFTPGSMALMEKRVREIAAEVIHRARGMGTVDFAEEVALRFPVAVVLGEVLGIPREDFSKLIYWSDVIAAPDDPSFPRFAGVKVVEDIYHYALDILASRRRRPKDDVLSMLAHASTSEGTSMSDEMFVRYFWSLVTGAFDTTASAISGGMLALIRFPDEHARLLAQPSLLPTAVEEILRWETPTIYFRRTATVDTMLGGKKISRGQRVVMCYASGNRDEDVFESPEVFDVGRKPNDHLSFGYGPHFCLGSSLARMEVRVLFEQILDCRLRVELRGETKRARSNFQNRIKQMPVTISSP